MPQAFSPGCLRTSEAALCWRCVGVGVWAWVKRWGGGMKTWYLVVYYWRWGGGGVVDMKPWYLVVCNWRWGGGGVGMKPWYLVVCNWWWGAAVDIRGVGGGSTSRPPPPEWYVDQHPPGFHMHFMVAPSLGYQGLGDCGARLVLSIKALGWLCHSSVP